MKIDTTYEYQFEAGGNVIDVPEGGFNVITADPAWNHKTWSKAGKKGRPQHYKRMTLSEIKAMPVSDVAAKDCFLFLWTTWQHLEKALEVMRAWGFRYSSNAFIWAKLKKKYTLLGEPEGMLFTEDNFFMGHGYATRKGTELCLLGRRGSPKRVGKGVRDLIIAPVREHSRKPDEFFNRVEQFADGPYLELNARQWRPGWAVWGDEIGKFGTPVFDLSDALRGPVARGFRRYAGGIELIPGQIIDVDPARDSGNIIEVPLGVDPAEYLATYKNVYGLIAGESNNPVTSFEEAKEISKKHCKEKKNDNE